MSTRTGARWWWGGVLPVAACGWLDSTPTAPVEVGLKASEQHPHVVLLTLDTLRADRLGSYGYAQAKTETLDAMANMGRRYTRAYSPLPLTIPSHATMFTGLYPPSHGIRSNGGGQLGPEFTTLAERLSEVGYHTGASVSAFVTTRVWGFDQGFDSYFDEIPAGKDNFWHGERRADAVVNDALGWVTGIEDGAPIFLWVHLYDAHFPYAPPPEYLQRTEGRPYDGEVAFVDDQVERLVEYFDGKPTLWVIASDHGEGLGEHSELTHGMFVYDTTQHVPLFLYGTGVERQVVEEPVSLADLLPTVLHQLGMAVPEGIDGRVVPSEQSGPVYMESYQLASRFQLAPHVAVVEQGLKLVATPLPELYDIVADPTESHNLAAERVEDVRRLSERLAAFGFAPPGGGQAQALDPAVKAQLEALGYVDGAMPVMSDGPLPDPKLHTDLITDVQKAERRQRLGKPEEAIEIFLSLIERYPKLVELRTRVAGMLSEAGREEEARAQMEAALALQPDNPQLRVAAATRLAEEGKLAEAAVAFRTLAEEIPFTPRIRSMAVMATRRSGDLSGSLALAERYAAAHPDDTSLLGVLGVIYLESGRRDEGLPLLQRSYDSGTPEFDVAYYLGARALGSADLAGAERLLLDELKHHERNTRAAFALSRLYMKQQKWQEQVDMADKVLAVAPRDPVMWHAKVLGLFNLERYPEAREALTAGLAVDPGHPDLILMDANLLAKEGREEEGKRRFDEAKAALDARAAEMEARSLELSAAEMGMAPPSEGWGDLPEATELPPEGVDQIELPAGGAPKPKP
jgi:arylsulfatase A-like enzyme/Flp pilus assembly protein TadD